ncbi:AAA family ATPase [Providencia rettgeri]|uniref:AAA family ATPase n=1 Tax=Providencia rettgeri TaxID=587 RepID=UPI000F78483A|nr:ATP-binding protein [Providencia rettgeri]
MINYITYDSKKIPIAKKVRNSNNIYSIIIGKNGTGKSRLLQLMCERLLIKNSDGINFSHKPSRIIAISTTPFDKFPHKSAIEKGYYYQGIKGIDTQDLSKGYISKFIGNFLLGVINKKTNNLSQALDYLGYDDEINIVFKYIGGSKIQKMMSEEVDDSALDTLFGDMYLDHVLNSESDPSTFYSYVERLSLAKVSPTSKMNYKNLIISNRLKNYLNSRLQKGEKQINSSFITNEKKLNQLVKSIENSPWIHKTRTLKLNIKGKNIAFNKKFDLSTDFINLIDVGLFKVDRVTFRKKNTKETFEVENASSGEQSVIINILGISSIIKDNSLVLIDEPEVCLHPEWQEKYITLLIDIFKSQKKCHFIIATHSPQIIANLKESNCFITSIEDNICNDAKDYIKKSSDYQLATLFNTPGFKNEYLSRISLNLLSKIMANKSIDNEDKDTMNVLLAIKNKLADDDPILSLIVSLEEMVDYYG